MIYVSSSAICRSDEEYSIGYKVVFVKYFWWDISKRDARDTHERHIKGNEYGSSTTTTLRKVVRFRKTMSTKCHEMNSQSLVCSVSYKKCLRSDNQTNA